METNDIQDVLDTLRKTQQKVITYPWPEFIKFKQPREKNMVFESRVRQFLYDNGYLVMFGRTVVAVCWDADFAPAQ